MIAWAALWSWPVVCFTFFNKYSLPLAISLSILGGFLFLPGGVGVDFPMLPRLNKLTVPTLAVLVLTMVAIRQGRQIVPVAAGWIPRDRVVLALLLILLLGVFGTVLTNRDVLVYGFRVLPGHDLYDAASMLMAVILILGPFFLGRVVFSSQQAQQTLLKAIVFFAIGYSFLALYEVRMSPTLNRQVYGFSNLTFLGQIRGNSWRPYVFTGNGLILALYFTFSVLAAAALARAAQGMQRLQWGIAVVWLLAVLVLCKSLGALLITIVLLPAILFMKTRTQFLMAFCIAISFVTFPLLRSTGLVPVDRMLAYFETISPDRAQSFGYRLWNEDMLIEKVMERPVFGWGIWGRQRVYGEDGFNKSTLDGAWIIEMGSGGWVRYIGIFGLLAWPVIGLFFKRRVQETADPICMGLILILCAKMVDLIPNSDVGPIAWLIAGALAGRLEVLSRGEQQHQEQVIQDIPDRKSSYVRGAGDSPVYARTFTKTKGTTEHQKKNAGAEKRPKRSGYTRTATTQRYQR